MSLRVHGIRGGAGRKALLLFATALLTISGIGGSSTADAKGKRPAKECGTKQLYGHLLTIKVRGELDSCRKVARIVRGSCGDGKRWSCFSFHVPGPLLAWFRSKERFDEHLSTLITARRYPCSEVGSVAEQWVAPTRKFPTRKQVVADDLIRCDLLASMEVGDVETLLGEADYVSTSHGRTFLDYTLGPERDSFFQVDSELLSVSFGSDGVFQEATIHQG